MGSGDFPWTVRGLAAGLAAGDITAAELVDTALHRIAAPEGEGARAFVRTFPQQARAAAAAADRLRSTGAPMPLLAGLPISVKDLFDVAGSTTTAGAMALAGAPPATVDATIVARLRAAGAAIVGTTNMTEFAFGGLGLNPHYGDARNPYDRVTGRVPGGSSSGAAVSVADGMAVAAIGSDTAGSVRIPAALCGIVGFKPTKARIPVDGTWPLAPSLDSIGPLASTVACAAIVDGVLAGEPADLAAYDPSRIRLGMPTNLVTEDLEPHVARSFEQALVRLRASGIAIQEFHFPELAEPSAAQAKGSFSVIEGYAVNREIVLHQMDKLDPLVAPRWRLAEQVSAADYIELLSRRRAAMARADRVMSEFDALICPTVPIVAPPIAQFNHLDICGAVNRQLIRNTHIANFLDLCALSIPCHEPGTAPVGLMLTGSRFDDQRVLRMGLTIESLLAR